MKKFNNNEYTLAGELFEKSMAVGQTWAATYLNAASSWANAGNNEKTFQNLYLFRMEEIG